MGSSNRPRETAPEVSAFTQPSPATAESHGHTHRVPRMIGSYRPLRVLGEGGMGVVYEAEQERPKRVVALKVIRPVVLNASLWKRFELEAEVLGRLQHPGIAQIYEAGTADAGSGPQPFFAMELVRGPRVDRYVSFKMLSTRQRVELMEKICDAIHYAHSKGVIHRDLKPGNILIDEGGQPKILDFGVARVTDSDVQATIAPTNTGQVLGTLQYMAPEQARGDVHDVDTAADVYALGVIAYELLVGHPPYVLSNRSLIDAVRVICDEEPTRIGTANRSFRGDLQTIIHKALEKDKRRRYASAGEFAADLRRYLNNEPIAARPPSSIYQARKFASRNRALTTGVIAVFVLLAVALALSIVSNRRVRAEQSRTLAQKQEAERQKTEAQTAGAQAAAANQFLWSMLKSVTPGEALGKEPTVRQVLDASSARVDAELRNQPIVAAGVHYTIGDTYVMLGHPDQAEPHLRRAYEIQLKHGGPDDKATLVTQNMLAFALQSLGRYPEAEPIARDAVARSKRVLGEDDAHTIQSTNDFAMLLSHMGRLDEAEPMQREVVARNTKRLGPDHPDTLYAIIGHTFTMMQQGDYHEAEPMLRDVLPRLRKVRGEDHPDTLTGLSSLSVCLLRLSKFADAEPLFRECLERRKRVMGENHPDTIETMSMYGMLLSDLGRTDESLALQRDALARRKQLFGEDHPATIASMSRLATTLATVPGHTDETVELFEKALAGLQAIRGPDNPMTLRTQMAMATFLIDHGRRGEATPLVLDAVARTKAMNENNPLLADARKLQRKLNGPSTKP